METKEYKEWLVDQKAQEKRKGGPSEGGGSTSGAEQGAF